MEHCGVSRSEVYAQLQPVTIVYKIVCLTQKLHNQKFNANSDTRKP